MYRSAAIPGLGGPRYFPAVDVQKAFGEPQREKSMKLKKESGVTPRFIAGESHRDGSLRRIHLSRRNPRCTGREPRLPGLLILTAIAVVLATAGTGLF
jgi:hypothetical protein